MASQLNKADKLRHHIEQMRTHRIDGFTYFPLSKRHLFEPDHREKNRSTH